MAKHEHTYEENEWLKEKRDHPLHEKGIARARERGRQFSAEVARGLRRPELRFTSTMTRTMETDILVFGEPKNVPVCANDVSFHPNVWSLSVATICLISADGLSPGRRERMGLIVTCEARSLLQWNGSPMFPSGRIPR